MRYKIVKRSEGKFLLMAGLKVDGSLRAYVRKVTYSSVEEAQEVLFKVFRARPTFEKMEASELWEKLVVPESLTSKDGENTRYYKVKEYTVPEHWRRCPGHGLTRNDLDIFDF